MFGIGSGLGLARVWDWLGHGVCFWEANPRRGFEFPVSMQRSMHNCNKVTTPFVVGAVVHLGRCLDLTTSAGIQQARIACASLQEIYEAQARFRKLY